MGTVALVTGGASGIGAAVARRYARDGADVAIADVNEIDGLAVAAEIGGTFVPTDVANESDNQTAVDTTLTTFGGLDVVHLNAGVGGGGDGQDFDIERYRRAIAVNIDGVLSGLRAALPVLADTGGGAIVATSSIAGVAPAPFDPTYAACKHAIVGLVRSLAMTWAGCGVTINAVCPGFVATAMLGGSDEQLRQYGIAVAEPDEIAAAVQEIVRSGQTGQAWLAQANEPAAPVEFPAIELSRVAVAH